MWEFFIRNNKFSYLFLIALLGTGIYSINTIPKESSPEVQVPIGVVTTVLPGAPAADVESLITDEIERGLTGSLENVKSINSSSQEGVSSIVVEFEADADIDDSISDLKDKIDSLVQELPSEAEDPFVSEVNFVDQPIITIAVSGDRSDFAFTQLAKDIERDIENIPGISRVEADGVRSREVTVIVDQSALAQYNLSLSQVTNALRTANQSLPIGKIENGNVLYNVAFEGDIENSNQIQQIAVATQNGQPVFVRDIATIQDDLTPASSLTRLSIDGEPSQNAISFNIYKQRGGDITVISDTVVARLSTLTEQGGLLDGLQTDVVLNAGDDIKESLRQLTSSGLQTVFLVVLVLVFAIGWREGLIAGTSIPLSFLFGFIGLYLSGNTINFLSLFALILGIGVLVDSGIVMVEGINRRMKDDPQIDKTEAALLTIREFSSPIIAGTLTTVSMFTGLFIVSGVTGQFIAVIPFTLIFVLFASLLVALGILPLIASIFLKRRTTSDFEKKQQVYTHKLEDWYRGKIETYINSPKKQNKFLALINAALFTALFFTFNLFAGIICGVLIYVTYLWRYNLVERKNLGWIYNFALWLAATGASVGIAVALAMTVLPDSSLVKVVFFEQGDVDFMFVDVKLPEGSVLESTDIALRRVEDVLYANKDIESFLTTAGSGNQFGSGGRNEKLGNVFITLYEDRSKISSLVLEDIRAELSGITDVSITVSQPSDGPPAGSPISVKFKGDSLAEITDLANQATEILKSIPGSANVSTSANNNSTEFVLTLNKLKAASLGLDPLSVSAIIRTAVYGSEATSLTTLDDDIDVIVKLNVSNDPDAQAGTTDRMSIDALTRISISTPSGVSVPLSSLVDVSLRESSAVIAHEDSDRIISLSGDITSDANAIEIQTELMERINAELFIPESVTVSSGGETDESNKAFIELFLALIVGVGLMLAVLVLQFNSYLHTRYVLSILPYSLIGIMVGLALTGNSLSFPSIMGFIALSGIVVNNSILLIDMMNAQRRKYPEKEIRQVVIDSAVNRLRPILLTTLTTVVGMIPLTYTDDLWAPLAYAVMFGLMFSVIITLVLVPIAYSKKPGALGTK
jgi:HAE1 family hydrophobic/amphiphilic exporter-1